MVREVFIIFIQVREKSGKMKFLVHVSFPVTLSSLFRKRLFHLLSVNVNFITLHITVASIYALTIY